MAQSLQLGGGSLQDGQQLNISRVNRLPIIVTIVVAIFFFAVIVYGLSSRGLYSRGDAGVDAASSSPASTFAEQLKRGVSDGIIGEPIDIPIFQPAPAVKVPVDLPDAEMPAGHLDKETGDNGLEPERQWLARLDREQREQQIRELQRQRMARMQAKTAALDSPLAIDVRTANQGDEVIDPASGMRTRAATENGASDLYAAALRSGIAGQAADPNGQKSKNDFFNEDIKELGYLPQKVVPARSPFELKRGSVIPATLITGINSDLPGRILAQVRQHVFDSATGHRLLIPQGTKLFGRYNSDVSFGQSRVLVVWTDIIFPDGASLQIGGMAGVDAEGYGGFNDKVDRHLLKVFGSAALLAVIGTGIDMAVPESSTLATQDTASDAARRNFAETFGRVVERTIDKNLNTQPTLKIRPGYTFNILVDQDIVFPRDFNRR